MACSWSGSLKRASLLGEVVLPTAPLAVLQYICRTASKVFPRQFGSDASKKAPRTTSLLARPSSFFILPQVSQVSHSLNRIPVNLNRLPRNLGHSGRGQAPAPSSPDEKDQPH